MVEAAVVAVVVAVATAPAPARCTRRSAPIAGSRLRYPLSPEVTVRSTAGTASPSIRRHEAASQSLTQFSEPCPHGLAA